MSDKNPSISKFRTALVQKFQWKNSFFSTLAKYVAFRGGEVTHDGRYLIIDVSRGCDPYNMVSPLTHIRSWNDTQTIQLYYYDLAAVDNKITGRIEPIPLFDKLDAKYDFIENDGQHFIFKTNKDAPMFKLVKVDISKLQDEWIEVNCFNRNEMCLQVFLLAWKKNERIITSYDER